jgi:Niemann-Pick C1 protein
MLLSSTSMCACFLIGSYTPMPAVQKFALYAAVSLFINFLLQSSLFLAIFILDIRRVESNRFDVFCCIKSTKKPKESKSSPKTTKEIELNLTNNKHQTGLHAFFSEIYAPFLMKDHVRMFVIILFASWLCSSLLVISSIHVGLEQGK